jgi:hypothetical protein
MKSTIILAAALLVPISASAALPPDAYQGDVWSRVTAGFRCVGQHVILPQFIRAGQPAGVYWYAVPNGPGACVQGGAAAGPQF